MSTRTTVCCDWCKYSFKSEDEEKSKVLYPVDDDGLVVLDGDDRHDLCEFRRHICEGCLRRAPSVLMDEIEGR